MAKSANAKKTKSKKTRLISWQSISSSRKNLTLFAMVLAFVTGGLVLGASTFAASPKNLKVCNHPWSYADIAIFYLDANVRDGHSRSRDGRIRISPGNCASLRNWAVRVDVDLSNPNDNYDVDSYKLGKITKGNASVKWGPCHINSRNPKSNPPNDSPYGVQYRNYGNGTCKHY